MMIDFADKTILITAGSKGIGFELARQFLLKNANVCICSRNQKNLDKAKNSRAETNEVIIVEGYMDVVSVYSSGIKNVIANSGTALTERQIDLIWKFFSNPIICLDGDQSGQSAALRIAEKLFSLIDENNKIYFSIMPEGHDPDDYIKQNSKNDFLNLLKDIVISPK